MQNTANYIYNKLNGHRSNWCTWILKCAPCQSQTKVGGQEDARKLGEPGQSAESEVGSGSIGFFSNDHAPLVVTKGNQDRRRREGERGM